MKKLLATVTSLAISSTLAQAGLYINAGVDNATTADGLGPTGANASYLAYQSDHENAASGAEVIYTGVSFSEDPDLTGTYDVGVSFSWPGAGTTDAAKQAFDRNNDGGYDTFWETWVGIDTRSSDGNTFVLSMTGLEANQEFTFTSYNFDTQNQAGTFTVDQTPSASETATSPFDFPRADDNTTVDGSLTPWIDNVYTFDVASDASGNLDITFAQASGTWIGLNGFDLVAVPEPSTLGLVAVFSGGILFVRRRFMI